MRGHRVFVDFKFKTFVLCIISVCVCACVFMRFLVCIIQSHVYDADTFGCVYLKYGLGV